VRQAVTDGVTDLVFLPLYPQYSFSTTRSSLNEFRRVTAELQASYRLRVVEQYCEEPSYIAALADVTRHALGSFSAPAKDVHLIFSAHGLPLKYIERGDPYLDQIKRSMAKATESLAHPGPAHLAFQSRLGPDKWLSPSTDGLIHELGSAGAKAICVVPIAFVSEHVETLNEIDIQYAAVARESGIVEFRRASTVQCHPDYISCLADLTEKTLHRDLEAAAGASS
jgi:ferrochelatase